MPSNNSSLLIMHGDDVVMSFASSESVESLSLFDTTGSGKTGIVAGSYLLLSSQGKVTLFISPLLALHKEHLATFKEEFGLCATAISSVGGGCLCKLMEESLFPIKHFRLFPMTGIIISIARMRKPELKIWLLETGAFADSDLDIKARTFNKHKPFCHQIFKDLIHNQWYGHKGEGVCYHEHFQDIPLALLVITTAAIECFLRGYLNGNEATQEFSESVFKTRWEYYFKKLSVLQKKSPVWIKRMRDGLYQDILNLANLYYLGIDEDQMKDEDFGIDFEALEDAIIAQAS
ncbi:hypothetical protein SERLADRAFT_404837 [Serpula lacrymans var. lacrymans S7.9]|uniref:DUF6532 domain-containing protein n=1 Tax=Serpula lacrymans var. lacrymans (strain S7.9) TaxID=578457 RepID=F8NFG3_SERL9|nr:uncharacterized protein SERLADRAFT_404837 [Serpula lacrymans var. lacrymans S7.9]EGO30842.1 hypothetical protein SERLADRAFT_404837 [Serpula lacrymans var. lacrymans S7.9]